MLRALIAHPQIASHLAAWATWRRHSFRPRPDSSGRLPRLLQTGGWELIVAWSLALSLWTTPALSAGVVIDRIAVIVGKHVIKASDIDRDLRATQFLNRAPVDVGAGARRQAAERLIDQTVIRDEMEKGAYARANTGDLDAMLKQVLQDRFAGSRARLAAELSRYGLTEDRLRLQLQWQLDVLKFIEVRFRPGVLVTDAEVRTYYDQHQAGLRSQFPQLRTVEALQPKIRASL
jgi:hypothetical protein